MITSGMGAESLSGTMAMCMKEVGLKVKNMAREGKPGQMDMCMKANGKINSATGSGS